jgi:hypothetical protein
MRVRFSSPAPQHQGPMCRRSWSSSSDITAHGHPTTTTCTSAKTGTGASRSCRSLETCWSWPAAAATGPPVGPLGNRRRRRPGDAWRLHASAPGACRWSSSRRMCSLGSRRAATTPCSSPSGSPMCPPVRFANFWSMVGTALTPGGRVCFVDDSDRESAGERFVPDQAKPAVWRRLGRRQRAPGGQGLLHAGSAYGQVGRAGLVGRRPQDQHPVACRDRSKDQRLLAWTRWSGPPVGSS